MTEIRDKNENEDHDVVPFHQATAQDLERYLVARDPHSEKDITNYVEIETSDETVRTVEIIRREIVLGEVYDIWNVITDANRWWVITNLTNLYSQNHFPSIDFTLSFHIGLMTRMSSRSTQVDGNEPSPFEEVFRRMDQADQRHDSALEPEDFQAVGMLLRESLLSLVIALRRRAELPQGIESPQEANFVEWSKILTEVLCAGKMNKDLRKHLKNIAKETWQLVNWLIHVRSADRTASSIAIHSSRTVIGHFIEILEKSKADNLLACPACKSRNVRTHFDIAIEPDGDYYISCGVCDWSNHPKNS